MYDLFIVGAGPIGCYFTQKIKEFNYKLIEEHTEVGKPMLCAGLVGENIFKYVEKGYINKINGAYIHHNGEYFSLRKKNVAYVLDREKFDKNLSKKLNISFKEKFLAAKIKKDKIEIKTNKGVYYSKYLVGCDGVRSKVRSYVPEKEPTYLKSIMYTVEHEHEEDMISFFLKPFSWIIPEDSKTCRVGVISENPHNDLRLPKGKVIAKTGGSIPLGHINTYKNNVFLIGDAASQTKPLTGGGLYYGIKAADIARNLFLRDKIEKYDSEWKKSFGKQILFGLLGKKIYDNVINEDMTKFYNFVKENKRKIEKSCDFDRHSSLLKMILSSPWIWPVFLKYLVRL